MGDSGLEILHGGVGGDVELGKRISKQIFVFAFDPISLNSLSFNCAKHLSYHHIIFACVEHNSYCLASFILLYIHYMLGLLMCVPHLYLINKSFT